MKKIFISADIEGVTGVTSWKETILKEPLSLPSGILLTLEDMIMRGIAKK